MPTFLGTGFNETITPGLVSPTVASLPVPGLKPGSGDDVIQALGGNDTADGAGGNDSINGGVGQDTLYGGTGNDTIVAGNAANSGNALNDRDLVYGGRGNDNISGGEDGDRLFGGSDNDLIFGGAGQDTLVGGTGRDFMNGNAVTDDPFDQDVYDFNSAADSVVGNQRDVVGIDVDGVGINFGDRIDLQDVAPGTLQFVGTAAFSGINQVRVIDQAGGGTLVQVNLAGGAAPEMEILAQDGDAKASQWVDSDFLL